MMRCFPVGLLALFTFAGHAAATPQYDVIAAL